MTINDIKYERPQLEAILEQTKAARAAFAKAGSAKEQYEVLLNYENASKHVSTMFSVGSIRFTLNTKDEFYQAENDYFDEISPAISQADQDFYNDILSSQHLSELKKLLPDIFFINNELSKKAISPLILDDLKEENAVTSEYTKLMAAIMVEFEGQKIPPSKLRAVFTDIDRQRRREAYCAYGKELNKIKDQLDDIFARLVAIRTRQAKKLGMKDYIELGYLRLTRNCYDRDMVSAFRENVYNDMLPTINYLYETTAKKMGIDKRYLYDHDVFGKDGNAKPQGTPDELMQKGKQMYKDLSPVTDNLMTKMLDFQAFDVLSREGKWGGGYCTRLADFNMPFILANFNGSAHDIDVLTHEFGHALHYALASVNVTVPSLVHGSPETSEVASMSMEFLTYKYMDLFFGQEAEKYKFEHLAHSLAFIPYGLNVDAFQHIVYEKPELKTAERHAAWLELERKFRPHMSLEGIPFFEEGRGWQDKQHIYERPFYYIDYCLAQCVALQIFALANKDFSGTFEKYITYLKMGGSKTFVDLLSTAGFISPFKPGALKEIGQSIEHELKAMQKI